MRHLLCMKLSPVLMAFTLLFASGVAAQVQTRRSSETFNVDEGVEVVVNTSYSDLVFETWNRDKVEVEAVIEVEGVSEEEAKELFKDWGFNVVGNSKVITISTAKGVHIGNFDKAVVIGDRDDFNFTYEFEMPDVDQIIEIMPENFVMPPMPPMPPMNFKDMEFDFRAYEKEGEAYLEKWKAEFQKKFDKDRIKEMEQWGKEVAELYKQREEDIKAVEEDMKAVEEDMKAMEEEMKADREERERLAEEVRRQLKENQAEVRILVERAREEAQRAKDRAVTIKGYRNLEVTPGSEAKVFFYSNEGKAKNLKIKKTIRIKAPKGAKLNLNVRHGEIKLAEHFKSINATLYYTRLHAPLVDGKRSSITASYSPLKVDRWKEGTLQVSYAKMLELQHVENISLESKSSNVMIGELSGNAIINGSFGDLVIHKFNEAFQSVDIVMENSDATLVLPAAAFDIYARTSFSRMKMPSGLKVSVNELQGSKQVKGYHQSAGSGRSIHIIANYSNVDLKRI